MGLDLDLSPDELRTLEVVLSQLSKRAKHALSLRRLINNWSAFVVRVAQGYKYSIYEYTNDLSSRDLLEDILEKVSQPLREKIVIQIQPWDDRFREATLQSERPLATPRKPLWWWYRIPKKLEGELETDLRTEKILGS